MSTNNSCERIQLLLAEWIGNELDDVRSADVRTHLTSCQSCRTEEAEMRELLGALARDVADDGLGGVPDPGERYWASFAGRVRTARAARSLAEEPKRSWFAGLVPRLSLGLAAAAVAAIAFNVVPADRTAPDGDTQMLVDLLSPPAADGLESLDDDGLETLEEALAARSVKPAAQPRPARDAEPGASGIDELDDLSPEQLDQLLDELDALT